MLLTRSQGIVKVGAIDMDAHRGFGSSYSIQGFPTIKIFGQNKQQPIDYRGDNNNMLQHGSGITVMMRRLSI